MPLRPIVDKSKKAAEAKKQVKQEPEESIVDGVVVAVPKTDQNSNDNVKEDLAEEGKESNGQQQQQKEEEGEEIQNEENANENAPNQQAEEKVPQNKYSLALDDAVLSSIEAFVSQIIVFFVFL